MIDGMTISSLDNRTLSNLLLNQLGIIFQNFNLLPTYTVYENVEVALVPKGFDRKEIAKLIMPYFERFNLIELSVGQQQKVAIIRTLAKNPSVILADEPTGSVDDETASEIFDYFRGLKTGKEVTVLFATHGTIPDSIADKIYIMDNGRIKG